MSFLAIVFVNYRRVHWKYDESTTKSEKTSITEILNQVFLHDAPTTIPGTLS